MATIKYRKREFNPTQNQPGMSHCWYAESVIVNELDTVEIARLIEARTGVRRYEAQSVLASFVELINEECAQSMRIKLSDEKGQKFVSIYPKISGSTGSNSGTSGTSGTNTGGNQGGGTGTIDTGGDNTGGNGGSTDPDDGDE